MEFRIKKGRHTHSSFWNRVKMLFPGKSMRFNIYFSKECWYPYENIDSKDYNKLYGMRFIRPHINEADIVWLPDFDREGYINLYWYGYDGKERFNMKYEKPMATIRTEEWAYTSIKKIHKAYVFEVDRIIVIKPVTTPQSWISIQPYFGGDNKSPNDMVITLDKL